MMTIQDHIYAAIDDTPKTVTELHHEVQEMIGRKVGRGTMHAGIARVVRNGCAVVIAEPGRRRRYQEPQDHFCEANFAKTAEDIEHGIPGVHIEVKRYVKFAWWQHVKQARRDAGDKIPTVMMRPNGDTDWHIAIPVARLREFVERIQETENEQ
jgi:hypothetical protein